MDSEIPPRALCARSDRKGHYLTFQQAKCRKCCNLGHLKGIQVPFKEIYYRDFSLRTGSKWARWCTLVNAMRNSGN